MHPASPGVGGVGGVLENIVGSTALVSEVQTSVASSAEMLEELWSKVVMYAARVPLVLIVLLIGWLVIRRYAAILRAMLTRGKVEPIIVNLIASLAVGAGWIVCVSIVFAVLGFNSIAVAFSGSLGLVALGLASSASSVVSDLYGGISLITDQSIRVGRRIRTAGVEGRVVGMSIRKLRLEDDQGNIHIIPNKAVDSATIVVVAESEETGDQSLED